MQEGIQPFMIGAGFMFFTLMSIYFARETKKEIPFIRILHYVLIFWAVLFGKDILYQLPGFHNSSYAEMCLMSIDMYAVAACAFFLMGLFSPHLINTKFICLNLIPFVLFTLIYAISGKTAVFISNTIWALVYSTFMFFYFAQKISAYNKMLKNNYSNLEYIDISWLKKALGLLVCCLIMWLYTCFYPSPLNDTIYYLIAIILWAIICYYSDQQEMVKESNELEITQDKIPLAESSYAFAKGLGEIVASEYLYKNPKLTISELANILGTNRTYLSDYLNNELDTTFYDFVNSHRIHRAESLLSTPGCLLTLEEIAEKSGFNSVSTFRRTFQKKYGCPPLQYKKVKTAHKISNSL